MEGHRAMRSHTHIQKLALGSILFMCGGQLSPAFQDQADSLEGRSGIFQTKSASSCWRMASNELHPGGPGQWVLSSGLQCGTGRVFRGESGFLRQEAMRVVRCGDRLRVQGHSDLVDISLRGIALEDAIPGQKIRARLLANGGLVQVVVMSPVDARLVFPYGVRQ